MNPETSGIKLIAFDVDGTLVEHHERLVIWQLLNRRFGGGIEVSDQRYHDFMAGAFSYEEWVHLDLADWIAGGATRKEMVEVVRELDLIEDARSVIDRLEEKGYRLAVISGTLDLVVDEFFPAHPFAEVYTNCVHFDAEERLESITATQYDMEGKAHALADLAERFGLTLEECAFVGDNTNDVAVAKAAGFSVAFNAKSEQLVEAADAVVSGPSLKVVESFFA